MDIVTMTEETEEKRCRIPINIPIKQERIS